MKYKKILSVLVLASAMLLGACNGGGSSAASSGKGSSGKGSSSQAPTTSREPTPAVECNELGIVKVENDVFLSVKGTATAVKETSLKFAFGLEIYQASSGQVPAGDEGEGEGESSEAPAEEPNLFVYGKETPADADYNIDVAISNNAFDARLKLTDLKANGNYLLEGGNKYRIYAGAKGFEYGELELDAPTTVLQDNEFKFYFRNDNDAGNSTKLVVDNLGPIRIEKATIGRDLYNRTGIFAKVGGANKENLTADQLNAFNSYVNFQKLPNTSTRVQKEGSQQEGRPYYFYVVEGNEAFIVINIDFMVAAGATSGDYNTHLNVKENKQENLVSVGVIDSTETPFDAGDGKTIAVYSHPGEHTEANIWGNVGFRVTIPEADAE